MLILHADNTIQPFASQTSEEARADTDIFSTLVELKQIVLKYPGERAVQAWNQLSGVVPITSKKFRNRATAAERIWKRLCELYPDAVAQEDMPKSKPRETKRPKRETKRQKVEMKTRGGWAAELETELRKRFKAGDAFELSDVYKLIPAFQRRHKENHHVAARLRTTLAQDLRGKGVVKTSGKGKYRMVAA